LIFFWISYRHYPGLPDVSALRLVNGTKEIFDYYKKQGFPGWVVISEFFDEEDKAVAYAEAQHWDLIQMTPFFDAYINA
jgi:hypothetical protein